MRINNKLNLAVLIFSFLLSSCGPKKEVNKTVPFSTPDLDAKVEKVMSNMTLAEKLVQIEGIRPMEIMEDGKISLEKCRQVIPDGIGHFCQFSSSLTMSSNELRDFVRSVQNYLLTETRTGIPAIFHEEAITGFATQGATTFPQQIGMGCSWNPEQIEKNSITTRNNMRAAGATFALSPMLDLSRTAHWERIEESYGEDAYLTSRLGLAFVKGLQGDDFRTGVAATTKHFAGYGTQNDNPKELYEEYIMPHEALYKVGGVKSVMPSYGKYKGTAVAISQEMLTDILRNQLKFDGLVVSDYGAINLVYKGHKQAESSKEAAVKALKAGMDIELAKPIAFPFLPEAIEEGLISMDVIDAAVKRSLIMKAKLGLLDEKPEIGKDGELDFDPPANRKMAYESACQSIVLLKNNGVLPLKSNVKKIALVGPNAATVQNLLGDYTYQSMISFWWSTPFDPNDPKLISLKAGLENRIGDKATIQHERGCDWSTPLEAVVKTDGLGDDRLGKIKMLAIKGLPQPDLQNALKISAESDVIIAAVGENLYLCGEGRERKGIRLPGEQEAFVEQLIATGKPVILVMFGGRQQLVNKFEGKCAAILQAWFPGEEGGNAIADIIVGNVNPSAKLCVTYPKSGEKQEINYKNAYDANNLPQYPFGYGLSYTTYEYSDIVSQANADITDDRINISCKVKNTGGMDGTEIVQLYVSPKDATSTMKPIQLKGFQRVELKVGEEKQITFKFSPEQLAQYKNSQWIVEGGKYEFKIGSSCTDIQLSKEIEIKGSNRILENGRNVFFSINE
ncbi:glycoside hydrolase family 3 N-terminal domain-containing protein [Labilibaculum antarcticum]|uniref:Beta-glucosidase n=1 Tax=Labilibaculum antarcticum TaxID=1717717 RepID=A0A1Y1CM68_9BACT|nr:glycoside hydrolase family 3 N-terminal domain-containing protein [Labilibaculum antarcticum]BAX81052.1 beta-glucosidase [Labilibaculum antarcticum]